MDDTESSDARWLPPYPHVVVPFDGTPPARDAAMLGADLAHHFSGKVVLLTASEVRDTAALEVLKRRAVRASDPEIEVWFDSVDRPAVAVRRSVEHRPGSLVCLASHGHGRALSALGGNVADKVLATVDAPVLITGPRYASLDISAVERIILCVDASDIAVGLAPLAAAWCRSFDVPCLVLGAVDRTRPDLEAVRAQLRADDLEAECRLVAGPRPVTALLHVLDASGPAIVVMGVHHRSAWRRPWSRSMIAAVVRDSPLPVLASRTGGLRRSAVHSGGRPVLAAADRDERGADRSGGATRRP